MNNNEIKSTKQPSIEDYASVEAICDGAPVHSFNNLIYVYGQSPDFYPRVKFQENNDSPVKKIKLKKSWEIKNNFIGFCHEMTPRTRWNDSQFTLPIHLIDGDPDTVWASFECFAPDALEEWIRIDLPMESMISSVVLTCTKNIDTYKLYDSKTRPFGNSLPKELTVKLSRDAWHWDTVYECADLYSSDCATGDPQDPDSVVITLKEAKPAKQIWISGKIFSKTGYQGYMFSISGVEVRDISGDNLALVSRGAGVTVSSTSDMHNSDRYSANSLWGPLQYNVGNKWAVVGCDNGSPLWCFTEHEKGVLKADEDFDNAVTEAVANGINIILGVDFKGNWIYLDPPRKTNWYEARFRELNDSYLYGIPVVDNNPEMYAAYFKYAEYMVGHFKDRVSYFQIGNEWQGWHDSVEWYKNTIFEPTYDVIKKVAPDAKIALCGTPGLLTDDILACLSPGLIAKDGKLTALRWFFMGAKDFCAKDITVGMDAKCTVPAAILVNFKTSDNFLAAVYDPVAKKACFLECVGRRHDVHGIKDILNGYEHIGEVSAEGMGNEVHMEVRTENGKAVFIVSDGSKSVTSECTVKNCAAEGSIGILSYPGDTNAEFSNFIAMDTLGNILFSDDFTDTKKLSEKFNLFWNHWGDPGKPPLAERLGAVVWHDWNAPTKKYFDKIRAFRRDCEKLGFKGVYFCNEVYTAAAYPPGPNLPVYSEEGKNQFMPTDVFKLSDMQEAKYLINIMVGYSSLNIESGPCHVHFSGFPHPQATCRTTVASQVVAPNQPKPTHYCIRNISTIMDDFYEADFPVEFDGGSDVVYFTLESGDRTHLMIAAYLQALLTDGVVEKKIDVRIKGINVAKAWGIDSFNGTEQELEIVAENDCVLIKGVMLKDYPVFLKLMK